MNIGDYLYDGNGNVVAIVTTKLPTMTSNSEQYWKIVEYVDLNKYNAKLEKIRKILEEK